MKNFFLELFPTFNGKILNWICISYISTLSSCKTTNQKEENQFNTPPGHNDLTCNNLGQKKNLHLNSTHGSFTFDEIKQFNKLMDKDNAQYNGVLKASIKSTSSVKLSSDNGQNKLELKNSIPTAKIAHIDFKISDIPLCLYEVTAYEKDKELNYIGRHPSFTKEQIESLKHASLPKWPETSNTEMVILNYLKSKKEFDFILKEKKLSYNFKKVKCLDIDDQGYLVPYWKGVININGYPFFSIANDKKVLEDKDTPIAFPNFFDLTSDGNANGTAWTLTKKNQSYQYDIQKVELADVSSSEYLCNSKFLTGHPKRNGHDFIYSKDHQKEINEITLFRNANEHANWITKLRTDNTWPWNQMILIFHNPEDHPKNYRSDKAQYTNRGPNSKALIEIAAGSSNSLINLSKDPEVISHELGHHIIFKYIYELTFQSKILHEGIADFFVYARNQNSCLASTVCIEKNFKCTNFIDTKAICLRRVKNTATYKNFNEALRMNAHLMSQIISGYLVELGNKIGLNKTVTLVLLALEYVPSNATIKDFIDSLEASDQNNFHGVNTVNIRSLAQSRELSYFEK